MRLIVSWVFLLFLLYANIFAQIPDSNKVSPYDLEGKIKASVQVDNKEVPLNRTVNYTIEISWQGDLERYEIEKFDNPVLTNLEIVGTSSSNWVGELRGRHQTIKTYEYVLKPASLGMAYIDGLIIEYKDKVTDKTQSLITNRLEVKVVDPVLERNLSRLVLAGGIFLSLVLIAGGGFFIIRKKKQKEAEERFKDIQVIPIEEKYFTELKEKVELQTPNPVESFSSLSKIFKRYLSERYQIPTLESSTQDIVNDLKKVAVSEKIIDDTEEILKACDVAKFSGGTLEHGSLERVYTLVENILDRNKIEYIEITNQSEATGK
jgi:hypothetical protein